jgi:hypothetical protein
MRSTASDSGVTSSRSTSPKSWNEPMSFSTLAQNPTDGLRDRQCVREQFDVRLDVRVDHVRDEFVAEVVSVGVDVGRPADLSQRDRVTLDQPQQCGLLDGSAARRWSERVRPRRWRRFAEDTAEYGAAPSIGSRAARCRARFHASSTSRSSLSGQRRMTSCPACFIFSASALQDRAV